MKKKIVILVICLILIFSLLLIIFPVIRNNIYEKKIFNDIYNNGYMDVKYLNKDNNYYIIKTKDKVLVLDLNYEEIISIDINKLKDKNLELVYRRNKLYYEEKVKDDGKLIYKFYNVETCELEYEISLGGI